MTTTGRFPPLNQLVDSITSGDRNALARAITLVESRRRDHRMLARDVLCAVPTPATPAWRIGISGVPGVGKSTFIEAFGKKLTGQGMKVAVLAVDPSSRRSGGSILGDKTRMPDLASDANAFVRPSPSAGVLGGVNRVTRETLLLCEAAGFDVVLVETVGVGQSETIVADMVDFFLLLMLPGAGDELQGIKKGIIELADMIAVNKADGHNARRADQAGAVYRNALSILSTPDNDWDPPVTLCSGLTGAGLDEVWATIKDHRARVQASGRFEQRRSQQHVRWMWSLIEERLMDNLVSDNATLIGELEDKVARGKMLAIAAADLILEHQNPGQS